MPSANRACRAGSEASWQPPGLLETRAQWQLPIGVAQTQSLRWAARALLLGAVLLLLAWAWALFDQARSGQAGWLPVMVAGVIGLPWLIMVWHAWQGLNARQAVTLRWGGLPPHRSARTPAEMPPGWSLMQGRKARAQAVSAHVVFDLGAWVLVKMVLKARPTEVAAWSWLDAKNCFNGKQGHHLRALLFSASANQVKSEQPCPSDDRLVVASSRHRQRQWFNLFSSSQTNDAVVDKRGALRHQASAQGQAALNGEFPDTVILAKVEHGVGRRALS